MIERAAQHNRPERGGSLADPGGQQYQASVNFATPDPSPHRKISKQINKGTGKVFITRNHHFSRQFRYKFAGASGRPLSVMENMREISATDCKGDGEGLFVPGDENLPRPLIYRIWWCCALIIAGHGIVA